MTKVRLFHVREDGLFGENGNKWIGKTHMDDIRSQILEQRDKETPYSVVEGAFTIARFFERELAEAFVRKMGHGYMVITPEEEKPWHDAKPGEAWRVTTAGGYRRDTVVVNTDGEFVVATGELWPVDSEFIVDANKVWPVRKES